MVSADRVNRTSDDGSALFHSSESCSLLIELEDSHLKRYPHFDSPLSLSEAHTMVNDPEAVAHHAFMPFLQDEKKPKKFRSKERKTRSLRSAARRDAVIYAAYRIRLAKYYEEELERNQLNASVLAYRKIPKTNGDGGKSNIEHAYEAVREIQQRGDCVAIKLDISKFFENIDHGILKKRWCQVLGVDALPKDHWQVYRAITRYSWVQRDEVYERLDIMREHEFRDGSSVRVPDRRKVDIQLCTGTVFREKIAGKGIGFTSLIKVNRETHGIPQGSPISDVLANLYLLDFDLELSKFARDRGGSYRRYSDDILLILPGGSEIGESARDYVIDAIPRFGKKLKIQPQKTSLIVYENTGQRQRAYDVDEPARYDGLEYLGFRFDGYRLWLRQSTVSGYRRKVIKLLKHAAFAEVRRYPDRSALEVCDGINWQKLEEKIGRIEDFTAYSSGQKRKRTFWSYAKRAERCFGHQLGCRILQQVKYRDWMRDRLIDYVERYQRKMS